MRGVAEDPSPRAETTTDVNGGAATRGGSSCSAKAAKASVRRRETSRPFPTRALSAYALRLSRVFASASGDARGVAVAVAAADAMASLAARYAEAGHAASASVDAAVVTRLCVSVSLAAIALPAPPCVAAGVRLATAAGLTSSTRLTAGVAPAVVAALEGAAGASAPEAAAALFSRVLFLTPEAEAEDGAAEDDGSEPSEPSEPIEPNEPNGGAFARRRPREPDARAAILDVACGALSALPEDDGVAGSLDEFAILTCALLSWPSIGADPVAARSRAAVQMVTGLGVAAFGPLAARFAALERGEYSSLSAVDSAAPEGSLGVATPTIAASEARDAPSRASPATRAHNRHNRRAFFRDACRAMGEAGCTSAQAWAQALRALAAAAAAAKADPDARLAAADLLVAWLDARVHAEGKGAWETKALAAAASELVDMDDAALAPACSALASGDVTAEPAAVVDAVLLGDVTPHADEDEDVKVRLAPWDPASLPDDGAGGDDGAERSKATRRAPRVRGVSVASEDRLRRWARTWLADAAAAAESLMAGNLRGRAGSGGAAAATPRSRRAAASANASSDVDSASDSDAGEPTETSETSESSRRRFAFLPAGGVDAEGTPARAPLALGEGWGDRTVDPLFPVLKSPATGGKRRVAAALSPALAAGTERVRSAREIGAAGATPGSLGGASPATSRRERRRARALGVPPGTPETAARGGGASASASARSATNPFARRASPPPRGGDGDGEVSGKSADGRAFRLRRREDFSDDEKSARADDVSPLRPGGLPPAPGSEIGSVDDLVRGLGEMQAFEVNVFSENAAVSPALSRRMRDADYKEASRRAKEISAARRAERHLASPTRGRPATPRAGPSA